MLVVVSVIWLLTYKYHAITEMNPGHHTVLWLMMDRLSLQSQ
jgi:hypothetical protein